MVGSARSKPRNGATPVSNPPALSLSSSFLFLSHFGLKSFLSSPLVTASSSLPLDLAVAFAVRLACCLTYVLLRLSVLRYVYDRVS